MGSETAIKITIQQFYSGALGRTTEETVRFYSKRTTPIKENKEPDRLEKVKTSEKSIWDSEKAMR